MYDDVIAGLRDAYDRHAEERDAAGTEPWKHDERRRFLQLLREADAATLVEVGAGTGKDGLFFQEHGLDVTCTDLSPAMVALCRQKGLRAMVGDVLHLGLPPASFDAAYALNCLLHVPKRDLPSAFEEVRRLLRPRGLFYLGVYGGVAFEGIWDDDRYEPKRFFSFHPDEGLREAVAPYFNVVSFERIPIEATPGLHFQSLVLRT